MPRVYIGVGSNIEPEINIPKALRMIAEVAPVVAISTFYRTSPIGSPDSPEFVNGVIAVDTEIEPRELKSSVLRAIETALGRVRCVDRGAARTIDLDIVVYGDLVTEEADLVIPDPHITERVFIAAPLLELDSAIALPGSGERLSDAVSRMPVNDMTPLENFTKQLRQEMNLEP